jgi:hypothetical protein
MKDHIKQPVIVSEVIKEVVAKVSARMNEGKTGADVVPVMFYHDTPEMIEAQLLSKDRAQAIKYPAVILFHDYPEDRGGQGGYYAETSIPRIAIVTSTSNTIFSDDRYARTFLPTLYPIYGWFMKYLVQHPGIVATDPNEIEHRKWDRLYWGTQEAGKELNDYLDAIELQNLKLTMKQFC